MDNIERKLEAVEEAGRQVRRTPVQILSQNDATFLARGLNLVYHGVIEGDIEKIRTGLERMRKYSPEITDALRESVLPPPGGKIQTEGEVDDV